MLESAGQPGVTDNRTPQPEITYQTEHRAFLLRLWRNHAGGDWRASLQTVYSGERHMFADLESLLAFLITELGSSRDA